MGHKQAGYNGEARLPVCVPVRPGTRHNSLLAITLIKVNVATMFTAMNTDTVESRDARMREIIELVREIIELVREIIELVRENFPNVQYKVKVLQVGPSAKAAIEARIYGPEPEVLREISSDIKAIFQEEKTMDSVRLSWSNKVPFVEPVFLEEQARRIGVTRDAVHTAFLLNNEGETVGLYREGSDLIPIVMRNDLNQRYDIDNLASLNVWSHEQGKYISMADAISNVDISLDNPILKRRNRVRMLAVYAEPMPLSAETAASVQAKVRPLVEELKLPDGYRIEWGGEYETSTDAQSALFASMPIGILGMFIITVLLFGKLRQALAIWGVIPLTTIGIIGGLVLVGAPFTFMALLGSLSLIGMVLKNGIVLTIGYALSKCIALFRRLASIRKCRKIVNVCKSHYDVFGEVDSRMT